MPTRKARAMLGAGWFVGAALVASAQAAAPRIWLASESLKVRPETAPPALQSRPLGLSLAAAGGECTGAQLVVQGPVRALRAEAGALTGAAKPVPISLARVATVRLQKPSGPEGATGEWPDPLIPARDPILGEARNAFPVDVPAGRAQAIFVEACVPRGVGAGRASGQVRLSWEGGALGVPVQLSLRAFDLPVDPSLPTAYGFSGYSAAKGHGRGPEAARELTRLYDLAALRRGITLFGGTQDAPSYKLDGDEVHIDWRTYDAEVGPFLDGTAQPGGARFDAAELREPRKLNRAQRRSWRRAWEAHFAERGWLPRLFAYVADEPGRKKFAEVEERARELRDDAPHVRRLVTTALSADLPSIDLWVPLINCLGAKSDSCSRAVERERYRSAEAKGAQLWWYQSCMSHGCNDEPSKDAAFTGWPSLMIDAPATANRALGVLAFAQGIAGELYFDVVFSYDAGDPWSSPRAFGGNGDGTLFYPGTPERIGGAHDVPVESLRLVQIARGLADHAYLSLCAQLGDAPLAKAEALALAPSLRGHSRDPEAYQRMREKVGARIEALLARKHTGQASAPSSPALGNSAQAE